MANEESDRPTHIEVSTPAPGDGEVVSVEAARQAQPGKRILMVLVVSLGAAIMLLGGYWAVVAPSLHRVDAASGGHGQEVTSASANLFHAPAAKTTPAQPAPG